MAHTISLCTYLVNDYDEAIVWFRQCLGFAVLEDKVLADGTTESPGGPKRWVVIGPPDSPGSRLVLGRVASLEQREALGRQAGGRVAFFLTSSDFDVSYRSMQDAGVTFREAPRQESYGKVAVFLDLYGNPWDLLGPQFALPDSSKPLTSQSGPQPYPVEDPDEKSRICFDILMGLPAWFGIPESSAAYIAGVAPLDFLAYKDPQGRVAGFVSLAVPGPHTTEIYVMGVREDCHGRGYGKALLTSAKEHARKRGHRFLLVKTLASSHSSPEYRMTREFYLSQGFLPLCTEVELWGEANPCLFMIQTLLP